MQKFKTYKGKIQKAHVRFVEMKTPFNFGCESNEIGKKFSIDLLKNEKTDTTISSSISQHELIVDIRYKTYTEESGWHFLPLLFFGVWVTDDGTLLRGVCTEHERKESICSELAKLIKVCKMIHGKYKEVLSANHRHGEA